MSKIKKLLAGLAAGIFYLSTAAITAQACTAVYVVPNASADGTALLARSNDSQENWPNYISLSNRLENQPGRSLPVNEGKNVFAALPATTYKHISTPWMDSTMADNHLANDATACVNEYGVAMTMSVTAFTKAAALQADPEPENGLTEDTANDLVVCQSKTAREAVEVLAGLIDKYGSSESNVALIADRQEAWYVEIYTGHEYAAVKLPADRVAVFGNEYNLAYLSDYEDSITSPRLASLAKENGFAVYGRNGELNLKQTYSCATINYSHMRTWIGHRLMAPSVYSKDYDKGTTYPLVFYPDRKISLQDVMEIMRNRFEGTKYDPDATGRPDMRVIGSDTSLSVHILQIYPELPAAMAGVIWECTAPDIYGVFVPVSIACTGISNAYGRNQPAAEAGRFDCLTYPWYAAKALNTLCLQDYKLYGAPVRAYWHEAETNMIAGMSQVLRQAAAMSSVSAEAAAAYVTDYCNALQEQAFADEKALLNTVMWSQSKNSNTLKMENDPETYEITSTPRKYEPIKVKLDGAAYRTVPQAPSEQ